MKTILNYLAACLFVFCIFAPAANAQTQTEMKAYTNITFPSADEVKITADLYMKHSKAHPFIVLCHQAGWSRGEYREIAPKLNAMGFNCMAIDQRSGNKVNDVDNETMKAAKSADKGVAFLDAEPDMIAAIKFARANHAEGKVILWGSSYSSALALRIAGENPTLVDGVLAFAPGEYFVRFGKPADWIATSAAKIADPAFITSAKNELKNWSSVFEAIPGDKKVKFLPATNGNHGSRALWEKFDDNDAYWTAVESFLKQFVAEEK